MLSTFRSLNMQIYSWCDRCVAIVLGEWLLLNKLLGLFDERLRVVGTVVTT